MTPQFITTKSGCRINVADIIQYSPHLQKPDKLWIEIRSSVEGENEKLEDMTAAELDALLSPPSSPIISPIPTPESLNYNKPFHFSHEGKSMHGVIDGYGVGLKEGGFYIRVCADGNYYRCKLGTNQVTPDV